MEKSQSSKQLKPRLVEEPLSISKPFSYYGERLTQGGLFLTGNIDKKRPKVSAGETHSCRETFSHHFSPTKQSFYFMMKSVEDADKIAKFFAQLENQLKLKPGQRLRFQKTTEKNVIGIYVSAWWRKNSLRRQLLTAFIRAALTKKDTFKQKLNSCKYFRSKVSKIALQKFLNGETALKNGFNEMLHGGTGWAYYFRDEKNLPLLVKG